MMLASADPAGQLMRLIAEITNGHFALPADIRLFQDGLSGS
jgi:hypothetical protein